MEPVNTLLVIVGALIILGILIIIIWNMGSSVKKIRTGALMIVGVIKQRSPLLGGLLEGVIKTFIWF